MHTGNKFTDALNKAVKNENSEVIIMNNSIEEQISSMESPDKELFMEEYQMKEPALDRLIHSAYRLLNLFTYFTAGEQEVRAWTITRDGEHHRQRVLFILILKKVLSKPRSLPTMIMFNTALSRLP
jgi:ribosome-binding ATPase YchF (GTP1/OBG family)